jgi:L-ascorbate metabolism protein UlaG (beta-lactamase superfamily)
LFGPDFNSDEFFGVVVFTKLSTKGGNMELTWFGTAGFMIKTDERTILIDPYFSRNDRALPPQSIKPSDIQVADVILISHGHFDHIYDVPTIAAHTGAEVYCGSGIAAALTRKGMERGRIREITCDGEDFDFGGIQAQAFFSRHVKFDRWLILKTLARVNFRLFRYLPLMREYPQGQVLSWRLSAEGKTIHHFGSAGSTPDELAQFGSQPTDILLVPLQGHSDIIRIAHKYVSALRPKVVIPNHQDDFFPPISIMVDPQPFAELVKQTHPNAETKILEINETVTF